MPSCLTFAVLAFALAGCEQAAPEPEPIARKPNTAARPTLTWTAPPAWTVEHRAERGSLRARYGIPSSGGATSPAELLVMVLEQGSSDLDAKLAELQAQFEGAHDIKREKLKVGTLQVELLEVAGTYRMPMGPAMGPAKKHAAHVLKKGWRALAAGVKTDNGAVWMFRMLGPNDAVEAARGAFRAMVEGMR